MDYKIALSKMMKERENKETEFEPCIGKVIKEPPGLTISIYDGQVILYPKQLYINNRLCNDYTRKFDITGSFNNITIEATSSNKPGGPGPHSHGHGTIKGTGKFKAIGTIINTDTLVLGDYVKVVPTERGQKWFVDSIYRKVE